MSQEWPADAPDWANYRTTDANGRTLWHERRPQQGNGYWITSDRYSYDNTACANWRDSLIERPKLVKQKVDWSKLRPSLNSIYLTATGNAIVSRWYAWNCDDQTRGNPLPDGLMVEYFDEHDADSDSYPSNILPWQSLTRFRVIGIQEGWEA